MHKYTNTLHKYTCMQKYTNMLRKCHLILCRDWFIIPCFFDKFETSAQLWFAVLANLPPDFRICASIIIIINTIIIIYSKDPFLVLLPYSSVLIFQILWDLFNSNFFLLWSLSAVSQSGIYRTAAFKIPSSPHQMGLSCPTNGDLKKKTK